MTITIAKIKMADLILNAESVARKLRSYSENNMDILTYLKENITTKTPLCEILDTFCKMCEMDLKDCELLFETGVFSFTCDELYYFSLVRQYEAEGEGYNQIHVDVIYPPSSKISEFSRADWVENVDEFKQKVLSSEEYSILKDEPIYKLDIYEELKRRNLI